MRFAVCAVACFLAVWTTAAIAAPAQVRIEKTAPGYRLTVDGRPFFIRGVGGTQRLDLAAQCGANSCRTWGEDQAEQALDEAARHGLKVAVGIWMGHERHGFNYRDTQQVADQLARARRTIERFKDHPALLLWGIGNEMEGYEQADNAAIWTAVNTVASLARRLDPNHPTMTVVAEIGGERVKNLHRLCPDVEIVGINTYAGVATIGRRYREAGGTKPYIITEFGPPGSWESPKTAWGAPIELSSTAKADRYRAAYEEGIGSLGGQCLGSYVFLWGHKQETTATWFGMLLIDGARLGAVDAARYAWTGKAAENRCPEIVSLSVTEPARVQPGGIVRAALEARDPDGDSLRVEWRLQRDPLAYGTGGDAEDAPPYFPAAIVRGDIRSVELHMPAEGGGYRLFAYLYDGQGGAAVANVSLYVDGVVPKPAARKATLPLVVYDEAERKDPPFVPAGYMGATQAIKQTEGATDHPHSGEHCLQVDFIDPNNWGGVVWQSPPNDWGDKPGGWNLTGAKRLSFWARGATGDETVSFQFGIYGADKPFSDTATGKLDKMKLSTDWQEFRLPLEGLDLTRIKSGFVWTVAPAGKPIRFFLDKIRYE